MSAPHFISWRGIVIPKIVEGARVDFIGPTVPYFGEIERAENDRDIIMRKHGPAFIQIVLAKGVYEGHEAETNLPICLVKFDPIVLVAHEVPVDNLGCQNGPLIVPTGPYKPGPNCPCMLPKDLKDPDYC